MTYYELFSALLTEHNISGTQIKRSQRWSKAFKFAWDLGHANGEDEVRQYFSDLVAILKTR